MPLIPYESPFQREQQVYRRGMQEAGRYGFEGTERDDYARYKRQQAAARYGQSRMNQLRQVARLMSPEMQALINQNNQPGVDPAAAWRNVSGAFSSAANQGGYADPRLYLQQLLGQSQMRGGRIA